MSLPIRNDITRHARPREILGESVEPNNKARYARFRIKIGNLLRQVYDEDHKSPEKQAKITTGLGIANLSGFLLSLKLSFLIWPSLLFLACFSSRTWLGSMRSEKFIAANEFSIAREGFCLCLDRYEKEGGSPEVVRIGKRLAKLFSETYPDKLSSFRNQSLVHAGIVLRAFHSILDDDLRFLKDLKSIHFMHYQEVNSIRDDMIGRRETFWYYIRSVLNEHRDLHLIARMFAKFLKKKGRLFSEMSSQLSWHLLSQGVEVSRPMN